MLYEKYEKKVRLFLQLKNLIIKFKVLIISVTIAVASFTTLFIATKGIIYNISIPEIIYGDDAYDIKVQSLFSNYTIYYREKDTLEWHQQKPLLAGSYELKVTTNGSFGEKIHIYPFEIQPKTLDVSLVETAIQFGTDIRINASLAYRDYIESFRFEFKDLSKNQTTVLVNEIVIHNSNGENVTNNYKFVPFEKQISFIPRKVSVTLLDAQFEYDGNHHYSSTFIINEGSLIEGHTIIVEGKGRIQNVGSIDNDFLSIHIYDGEIDVTSNYDIEKIIGQIEVYKRKITIETLSQSKVYDGTPLSYDHFEIKEGTLVLGHQFIPVFSKSEDVIGIVKNKLESYQILDENGLDVTTNYDIEIIEGTLEILKRAIKVKTSSLDKIYDATPLTSETFEIIEGSLVNDHEFIIQGYSAIIHVGTLQNQLTLKILNDEIDVTAYYDISFEYGTLTVHPRPIRIESESSNKIYDGTPLSYGVFNLVEGSILNHEMILKDKLEVTDVGIYENRIVVEIYKDSENITKNYDIQYTFGTLEIHPKPITIKPKDEIKTYDGKYLTSNIAEFLDNSTILEHHQITIETNGLIKYVGIVQNHIEKVLITENEKDVTHNYEITYEVGYLEITKRLITIETHDSLKTYDGKYFSHQELSVIEGSIVDGETYVIIMYASVIDAGIYENIIEIEIFSDINVTENYEITYVYGKLIIEKRYIHIELVNQIWIYDDEYHDSNEIRFMNDTSLAQNEVINIEADGRIKNVGTVQNHIINYSIFRDLEDVTENYIVEVDSGELSIHPRPITIESKTDQKIYDETSLYNIEVKDVFETLIEGHRIEVIDFTSMINVGSEENIIVVKIYDSFDIDVTENYVIDYQYGILEIFKRPITIESESDEKVYDNEPLFNTTVYDMLGMLIDGHKLEVIDYQVLIEAGSIENVVTIVIKDVLDNDVTHNYDITYEYGTLTVHPRPITIKPKDVSKIYDGEYLTSNIVEIVEGSLLDNHFIEIITNGYIKKAGRINNEIIDVYIYDNIKEVTKNYEITYVIGYLEVIPRDLYIQTSSSDKEYDGFELFSLEYYDINHQLVIGDFIIIDNYSKIKNVDVVENILDILIFDSNYDNVTESYHIIFEYGLLEIYPRYIKIKPIDIEKVYDDQVLISNEYEIIEGSLAINETLMIETLGSIIEVGSIENEIIGFNMYNIENEETTLNYIVDIEIGYLKIIPRPIMIYSESETWIYNDEEFFNINISYELSQLVIGHQIRVIDYAKIIDVEVKQNELYVEISRENGDDVTHNYDISYSYGTLEVLPRPITVLSKSKDKIYDGYLLEYHEYEITFGSLVLGHELLPVFSSSITDVGEVNNDIEVSIYKGLRDVTLNYEITYDLGILKIYPRPITIETLSNSKTYDGEAILNPGYILKEGNLVLDHYFIIIEEPYMVDAGIQYNELVLDITNGERSYLSNYDITYIYGELIILPRPITIQTASDEKTYDDIEFYNLNHTIIEGSLVLDHLTIVDEFTVIKDAILTNNILRIKIVDSYSEDKTSNYDITYVYGLLEIYKRYVKIETASNHKIYDGLDLSDQNYMILDGSFVDSHTLIVLHSTKIKYVGSEFNYFVEIDILNANNESVLSNYLIDVAYGVLTIDPRPLSFIVSDKTFEYNGEPQTSKAYELLDDTSFGNDDILTFISTYITDVGTIENRIGDIKILNGEMDVTSNYLIDYVEGMLTVEPRYVRVRTNDDSKMFDGIPLTNHEFTIFEGSFVLDHELILAFDGIQAEIGISPNSAYEYYVLDGLGVDKTYNYIVDIEFGLLEVTRRVIEISTPSAEKVYDGLPLTAATYEITLGSVILEHQLIVHVIGSITEPGKMKNNYEFVILDTYGNDVSHYYIVQENLGTLKVIDPRIKITITSENASKPYDGTPLISEMWELTEGMLLDNHQLYVIMTGSQTEVGTSNNTFTYVILDENLEDIADIYYQVVLDFGTLYVYDENSSGGLPPGGIPIVRTGTPSDDASLEKPLFKIFSEVSTMIYLRYASYGDYIPETGAFDEAIQYFGETVSPLAWPGYNLNQQSYLMKLETIVGGLSYMMPYYSVDGFNNRLSDVFIGKGFGKGYEINFIPYESDEILKQVPPMTHFSEEELVYREFVREHYLNIPEETKAQMLRIARQNGIKNTSPTLIEDIQLYILSAAIYNMDFDTIPDGVDAAVYFLEYLREGICQHFAMAATVMYRAFGIPARYVTGFVADAEKNEWVEVTAGKGHAWVEIYVDGFGWIPIEVTPGGAGGTNGSGRGSIPGRGSGNGAAIDGGEGGEGEGGAGIGGGGSGPIKPKITIQTSNDSKVYDGTPLENKNYYVSGDIKTGHEVIVNVTGTITQVGEKRNTFEYFIVDENGNDVASEYQIVKIPGTLVVVPVNDKEILEISLYNLTRVYNGKTFENKDGYWISSQNLPSGYKVELEILGSIKDVGIIETYVNYGSVRVYDEKGIDVTNRYNVVAYYGTIEVVKLSITLTTETKMKIYDGTPLTAHNTVVSKGKLINGDTLVLQYGGSQTIVGESKNNLVLIQIFDKNNQNVTNNYHITVIEGILTVIDTN